MKKIYLFIFVIIVSACIFSTCAPINIAYGFINRSDNWINDTSIYLNAKKQVLRSRISLKHYPSKKVVVYFNINLINKGDVSLNDPIIRVYSTTNIIDTLRINNTLSQYLRTMILRGEELRINISFESEYFNNDIRKLVEILRNEQLQFKIKYHIGLDEFVDSLILMKPNLDQFK